MRCFFIAIFFILTSFVVIAQTEIKLYPDKMPNSKSTTLKEQKTFEGIVDTILRQVSMPTLTIFKPEKSNGTAVVVVPGGGYHALLISREGYRIGKEFNKRGVTVFVLKYRLPNTDMMIDKSIVPLQDIQQAIKTVRENAKSWGIDTGKIGVLGFSAGGHLAASSGVHFDTSFIDNKNRINLRPNFMILVNPVISFTDAIGHIGSRNNLLGENPTAAQIRFFSAEQNVTSNTPPTILLHCDDDTVVPVENSTSFYTALRKHKVPASLHIYAKGEHGFLQRPELEEWFGRCLYWMEEMNLIPAP